MKNIIKTVIILLAITSSFAQAATVDSGSSVNYLFDFSEFGTVDLHQFIYNADNSLPDSPDTSIEPNGSFRLDFGTSLGDDSVASFVFTNPFDFPIEGVGSIFSGSVIIPSEVSLLFVSVNYIDDVFDIETFDLLYFDMDSNIVFLTGQMVTSVPLPAPIILLASGMVFLRLFSKTKLAFS